VYQHVRSLHVLIKNGELRIPRDLSIVSFDQAYSEHSTYLEMEPTVVALPLKEIGQTVTRFARQLAEGQAVPARTFLPCRLIAGQSVAPHDAPEAR
jgi:DNA-binding LacI/PurR family transcriptional regulator